MTKLTKEFLKISPPPVNDPLMSLVSENKNKIGSAWQDFHSKSQQMLDHHSNLTTDNALLNPDFHWSRTKGNTPTIADGEFVEKWNVKSNGMAFTITPTFHTSTTYSADSGSDRFINVSIPNPTSADFELYQEFPNTISLLHNKKLIVSGFAKNKGLESVKMKAVITFDINNDGTPEFVTNSKTFHTGRESFFSFELQTPKITTDNQSNKQLIKLILFDLSVAVDLDLFYLKAEFNNLPTRLYVNHLLEKVKIDAI